MSTETNFPDNDLNEFADLVLALEDAKPKADPDFTEALDTAVADHFPPDWSAGVTGETKSGFGDSLQRWIENLRAHMLPVTAGLAGLLLVVVAVGVGVSDNSDGPSLDRTTSSSLSTTADSGVAQNSASSEPTTGAAVPEQGAPEINEFSDTVSPESLDSARSTSGAVGPLAAGVQNRKVAQEAEITLGTKPENVQDVSNDIIKVVDDHNGIVLDSSVEDGPAGQAGAIFSLMIPSNELEDAVGDLSGIADLKSRSQQTEDITAPTLTTQDELQTANAKVQSLVKELSEAVTDADRTAIEADLRNARLQAATLTTRLNKLERKANLTPVTVTVVTDESAGSGDNSTWGIDDAVNDAGHMLGIAAGVALIALAIAIPIGIIVLISLALNRAWVRRSRRRALKEN